MKVHIEKKKVMLRKDRHTMNTDGSFNYGPLWIPFWTQHGIIIITEEIAL